MIRGHQELIPSTNDYDWLGEGIYFWESNPSRAETWAKEQHKENWAVIGAYINLGFCLNLLDNICLQELKSSFEIYKELCRIANREMPKNTPLKNGFDLLNRKLDCAVIRNLHALRKDTTQTPYDTIRGVFWEGEDLYENAGFKEKNHIQIAVVDPKAILGYFNPRLNS